MKSKILKNKARQELTAPILVPDVVDHHGDIYSEDEILKACRDFEDNCKKANLQHAHMLTDDQAQWVESYTTIGETIVKSEDGSEEVKVPKGTWMGTMRVNEPIWKAVQEGNFTGFSIQCKANKQQILKAKKLGETGNTPTTRLSEFDFSGEDHAVALVDEAANATEILVMKAHKPMVSKGDENPGDLGQPNKDNVMTLEEEVLELKAKNAALEAKDQEVEATKAEAATKAKEEADSLAEKNSEELEKALKENKELLKMKEEVEKAAAENLMVAMVEKAESFKADDKEEFAEILTECKKALNEDQFETLEKQLGKLSNIKSAGDVLKSVGDGATNTEGDKTPAEVAYDEICKSISAADPKLKGYEVRNAAVSKLKTENPEFYKEVFSN